LVAGTSCTDQIDPVGRNTIGDNDRVVTRLTVARESLPYFCGTR
jgi:hypothetical protein